MQVGGRHHEHLLPAEAQGEVAVADVVQDHARRRFQDVVAPGMSQLVIHPFEMIDVDHDEHDGLVLLAELLQPLGKHGEEIVLVLQPGERVEEPSRVVVEERDLQGLLGVPAAGRALAGPGDPVLGRGDHDAVAGVRGEAVRIVQEIGVELRHDAKNVHEGHLGLLRDVEDRFPESRLDPSPDLARDGTVLGGARLRAGDEVNQAVRREILGVLPAHRVRRGQQALVHHLPRLGEQLRQPGGEIEQLLPVVVLPGGEDVAEVPDRPVAELVGPLLDGARPLALPEKPGVARVALHLPTVLPDLVEVGLEEPQIGVLPGLAQRDERVGDPLAPEQLFQGQGIEGGEQVVQKRVEHHEQPHDVGGGKVLEIRQPVAKYRGAHEDPVGEIRQDELALLDALHARLRKQGAQGGKGSLEAHAELLRLLPLQARKLLRLLLRQLLLPLLAHPSLPALPGEDLILAGAKERQDGRAFLRAGVLLRIEGDDHLQQGGIQLTPESSQVLQPGAEEHLGIGEIRRGARTGSVVEIHLPHDGEQPVQAVGFDAFRPGDEPAAVPHDPGQLGDRHASSEAQVRGEVCETLAQHLVPLGEKAEELDRERLARAQ